MNSHPVNMLFLNKTEVDSLLNLAEVYGAVHDTFLNDGNGEVIAPLKEIMRIGKEKRNGLSAMAGANLYQNIAGVKWTNFFPLRNVNAPTLWGQVMVLTDTNTGLPIAVMDATSLTTMRTSGGHALVAAKYLAKKESKVFSVLGCGAQGKCAIKAFDDAYNFTQIKIFDLNEDYANEVAKDMQADIKAEITVAKNTSQLCENSDILFCATTSKQPVIFSNDVPQGCTILAMYAFNDVDIKLSETCEKWVVGHMATDVSEIVEIPEFKNKLTKERIYSDLGKIVSGKIKGRENDAERIIYTHVGMCPLDISVAKMIYDKAIEKGMGQILKLI